MKTLILTCLLLVSLTGCTNSSVQTSAKGFLAGKITIAPLCPVEKIPPDPACQATLETYKSWPSAVYSADKKTKLSTIEPTADGNYKIELPQGNYIVDFTTPTSPGSSSNLPEAVLIKAEETTNLNINIDTGIR